MAISKVVYDGTTLIDLTSDTVTPDMLLSGVTAHDASGKAIVGTAGIASSHDGAGNVTITLTGVTGIEVG